MEIDSSTPERPRFHSLATLGLTLLCAVAMAARAQAATFTVTNIADNGAGTLRAALASAANGDSINFSVTGSIKLTSGQLMVTRNVTINGPGAANLAVNGNHAGRVFRIASNTVVSISGLTVTNGHANSSVGGGIYNDHASLTVNHCTVSGNSATGLSDGSGGGIFSDGQSGSASLQIVNSTLSGNSASVRGGGIFNFFAILNISNCTLSGNSAASVGYGGGGGIFNGAINSLGSASLQIVNSTLSGNSAGPGQGGGIWNDGEFGRANSEIVNSTLSGNSAGEGGGIFNDGFVGSANLRIVNTTLSGNSASGGSGGGIYNYGIGGNATLEIGNTILHAGVAGGTIFNYVGTVTSLGYNLCSDTGVSNFFGTGSLAAMGDQINSEPMLGPLQDNGGPTFTHALLCGSPAFDRGKNLSASPTDQRGVGFARTFDDPSAPNATGGDGTDIGAFDAQAPIMDSTPPGIICPSNITVEFMSETGTMVYYTVTAADLCDTNPVVNCVPPSGTVFRIGDSIVQCTARDASGNSASCSLTVSVLGARGVESNVLAELIALRATATDRDDGRKLDEAIEHLTKALDSELWLDQTHLEREHGEKMFQEDKKSVQKLCELIKSNKSNLPDAILQGFVDRLLRADRLLASLSIQEAIAAGVSKKKIEQAQRYLAKGDAASGDDKCDNGIDDYRNAWEHAVRAKVSPPVHLADGNMHLEVLGEPDELFTIQASSDLANWESIGTGRADAEGAMRFELAEAGRYPARFYRAISQFFRP